jgi:hypothetical protein
MEINSIEIKPANADALRNMAEQIKELSAQYQGAVSALAISYEVPPNWQWDGKGLRFIAPPATPEPNGNGNGHAPELDGGEFESPS